MNPTVIEAARRAFDDYYENDIPPRPGLRTEEHERLAAMESAINAAMMALAPDVRKAVEKIRIAAYRAGAKWAESIECEDELNATRDLFALLGIPEGGE